MKEKLVAALVAMCAGSGCVVVSDDSIVAGDAMDAHFLLTWTTNDAASGTEIGCQTVGADTVRIQAQNLNTGDVIVDLFDCAVRSGTTYALSAGDYSITVDLVACGGSASCTRPAVFSTLTARGTYGVWSDDDVDLGHFVFLVR